MLASLWIAVLAQAQASFRPGVTAILPERRVSAVNLASDDVALLSEMVVDEDEDRSDLRSVSIRRNRLIATLDPHLHPVA
jgi:hypothetical protein